VASGFRTGLAALKERVKRGRLSTGSSSLDRLIGGGVEQGCFYLFYGGRRSGVDKLIHRLLVNCLLPSERGGLEGRAVYLNCGNYKRERTLLDSRLLTRLVKARGLDPSRALEEIYVVCAFSPEQQEEAVRQAERLVEADSSVRLVAVHNVAALFTSDPAGLKPGDRISLLQRVVLDAWTACAENGAALVATCRPDREAGSAVPQPEGGQYLRHMAGVIVYLRRRRPGYSAYLVKHPSLPPRRVEFKFDDGGGGLGRITDSFRTQFQEELAELERSFLRALRDPGRREAFDRLVEAWGSEQGAMSVSGVPTVLDVMLLTALLDNRKRIEELGIRIDVLQAMLREATGQGL